MGTTAATRHLSEALHKGQVHPTDFSIRELAEAYMGPEWVDDLRPKRGSRSDVAINRQLLEADGTAVQYSDFSNITGQIFFNYLKESYEFEDFVFTKLVETRMSDILDMERIPGVSHVGDEFSIIPEDGEYPTMGMAEDFIDVAAKIKRGGIVPVTKEAIFGDRTGYLLERAKKLGWWLGWNKEKRVVDALIDNGPGAKSATLPGGHRYRWRNTDYATFQSTSPWINNQTANPLTSWVSVQTLWLLMAQITDPFTGEPIIVKPTHLIVSPDLEMTAWRVLNATEVRTHWSGYATTGNLQDQAGPSPISAVIGNLKIASSRLLRTRASLATDWWLSNPRAQVAYFAAWDVLTEEAPSFTQEAFRRDVVFQFKASEMGAAGTLEPRVSAASHA